MVEHPVSMEYDENSSDIELSLDVTEETDNVSNQVPPSRNGLLPKKVNPKKMSNAVIAILDDDVVGSADKDLNGTIEEVEDSPRDGDAFNDAGLISAPCETIDKPCGKAKEKEKFSGGSLETNKVVEENHSSKSSLKTNGFPSRRASETDIASSNSTSDMLKSALSNNGVLSEVPSGFLLDVPSLQSEKLKNVTNSSLSAVAKKSVSDTRNLINCDKPSNQSSKENRINGDIPRFLAEEGSSSPATGKRRLDPDVDSSESRSADETSFMEKRPKVDDDLLPNRHSVSENSIRASTSSSPELKKKTTARKSVAGAALKTAVRIIEEESRKQREATDEIADVFRPIENDVDDMKSSPSNCESPKPVASTKSEYLINFTPESMSDECLKNIFKKIRQRLSRRQLEEIVLEKCCEMISESSELGDLKKQAAEQQQTEVYRKQTAYNLEKQIYQLKGVCNVFMEKARALNESNRITMPTVVTRSVGLQVAFDSNPYAKFDSAAQSTRKMSVDEDDQRPTSSAISSQCASVDAANSSGSSSPASLPRSSTSSIAPSSSSQKSSLPADGATAVGANKDEHASTKSSRKSSPTAEQRRVNSAPPPSEADVIVDLTDLDDKSDSPPRPPPVSTPRSSFPISRQRLQTELTSTSRHPAPLPPTPASRTLGLKILPPQPDLTIQKNDLGIQMTWDLALTPEFASIDKYQIFAYQETSAPASIDQWKSVGDVDSLDLPMACTLTQFVPGYKYHFAVRAVDSHGRIGPFSCARTIAL